MSLLICSDVENLLQDLNCYAEFLLSEAKSLTEEQISMLLWEIIIETSDTTLVVTEWAMYELAQNPKRQAIPEEHYHFCCLLSVQFLNSSKQDIIL